MSVHSEVQNLRKNKSGNAPLFISSRSGDIEEGNEYFDLRADTAPNALEVLERKDSQTARKEFLYKYFTLLKERLNRFEFEYIKQLYSEGQAESVICDNLGLNPKKFKRGLQKKLTASAEDIAALVAASDWDDAELFAQCFLSTPQDIQDVNEAAYLPKTVKGFGNLIERLSYRRYRKIYQKEWYRRRQEYANAERIPARLLLSHEVKQRVRGVVQLFNMLCVPYLEKMPEEFRGVFYRSCTEVVHGELLKLFRILVEGVPIADILQEERAERERKAEERRAEEEREGGEYEDEEGAPVGAAV